MHLVCQIAFNPLPWRAAGGVAAGRGAAARSRRSVLRFSPKTIFRVQPAVPRLVSLAACETPPAPAKPRSSLAARRPLWLLRSSRFALSQPDAFGAGASPVPPLAAHPYGAGFPPASRLQCAHVLAYNSRWPLETKAPPAHRASLVCGVVDAPGLDGASNPLSRGPYFISIPTSLGLRTTSFGSIFAMWSFAAVPSP